MPKLTFIGAGSTVFAKNVIGDCFLVPEERVTRTNFHYWKKSRKDRTDKTPGVRKTVYSGPAADDPLQPSGLTGPVEIIVENKMP